MIEATSSIASSSLMDTVRKITQTSQEMTSKGIGSSSGVSESGKTPSFGDMLSNLVQTVNAKSTEANAMASAVMTGKSDNIHQAMLSMQEAGTAFTMMSEVRNKLVGAYNELMRMQV